MGTDPKPSPPTYEHRQLHFINSGTRLGSRLAQHASAIIMEDNTNGPVFRATKRRKVFRKRADSDANSDEPYVASTAQGPDATTTPVDATNNTADSHGDASTLPEAARVRRPKKHGIAFSSSDPFSSRLHSNEETAVVVSEDQTQDLTNGRFARQTGRTVVADDKHMCVLPPNETSLPDTGLTA